MEKRNPNIFLLAAMVLLLASCGPQASTQIVLTPSVPVVAAVSASPTTAPSPVPLPEKVIVYAPSGAAPQAVQDVLAGLSESSALVLENRTELKKEELGPEVKLVILPSIPGNLEELLAAAPQVQFLAVSSSDLTSAGNLTVLRQRLENQAFLAGFVTALVATDYRAAGLLPEDGPLGAGLADAFINGGRYYCGVCASGWPYNAYYPQTAVLPAASDGPTWQAALAGLYDNQKVMVYYLAPETARAEVLAYLQGKTQFDRPVLLVGEQLPSEELRPQFAAAIHFDLKTSLNEVWPEVSSGKGGRVIDVPLLVEDVNPDLLGPGRMRLVDDLLADLQAGKIYPFTLPQQ